MSIIIIPRILITKKLVLEKVNGIKIFNDYFKTIMNSHFSQNIVNIKNSLKKIRRTNISFEDIEKIIIKEFNEIRKTICNDESII